MRNCPYCKEDERNKVKEVVIVFKHNNPKAYGYPEVCNWEETYTADFCPMCKRKLDHPTEKGGEG